MDNLYSNEPQPVNGRVLLELHDGKLTLFPITKTDEETRVLVAAILEHIANHALRS
jgi:hypothetical protein